MTPISMAPLTAEQKRYIYEDFNDVVNLNADELEAWLATEAARWIAQQSGEEAGPLVARLRRALPDRLTDDDYRHMRTVVEQCHRRLAQQPRLGDDAALSAWRFGLMCWGRDPLRG